MPTIDVDALLSESFPKLACEFALKNFQLKDFQKSVVANVVAGKNTLGIMPTGGGKSLIYWLSGLALGGITLVVSPLIALIDEQAGKLREQGCEVLTIHGGISANKQIEVLKKFGQKSYNPQFIFVSPERISTDGFFEYCILQRKDEVKLLVIDEVHCVSQWGYSFRPFYKRIPVFLQDVFGSATSSPVVLALTATLNPKEIADICREFTIDAADVLRDNLLIRSEVNLIVYSFANENEKEAKFWDLLSMHQGEKILVYVYRKYSTRGVEDLASAAKEKGIKALAFHGDMSAAERQQIIRAFRDDELDVVFATNAFGMGIDIPDIRVVIHFMMPESVEQYYQEIGRAARDKGAANAYVLYTQKNIQVKRNYFIDRSFPDMDDLTGCLTKIGGNQIGLKTLQYFEDDGIQQNIAYFLDFGILKIQCKGSSNLKMLSDIKNTELQKVFDATKTKSLISIVKQTGKSPKEIMDLVYSAILKDEVKMLKGFDKCLIIDVCQTGIPESAQSDIMNFVEERRKYKHDLLDYYCYLLDQYESSLLLHQEIGRYFGVPKHLLNRLYLTTKGERVRSKSEVIVANILHSNGVPYEYEQKLFYEPGRWIEPDFTLKQPDGTEIYWEHLGMLGVESYDERWKEKKAIYQEKYPEQLVVTYEGTAISEAVKRNLTKLGLLG